MNARLPISSTLTSPREPRAFSLVELLVALAIGLLLISAAVTAYVRSRAIFETDESASRLLDAARYALSVIEPDIELAGYYGRSNNAANIRMVEHGRAHTLIASAYGMRQAADTAIPQLGSTAHACGRNFAIDLLQVAQGSNNHFELGPHSSAACSPYAPGAQYGSDTLTLRRAAVDISTPEPGRVQILASRLSSLASQMLFVDGQVPEAVDADHEIHDLVVRAYYIAQSAVDHPRFPALRVKSLTTISGKPAFSDSEVMPGVEDLQIQFGLDTGTHNGQVGRYVNPDYPDLDRQQIVAVRVWVRVRAENPEPGFVDSRRYEYADVSFVAAGADRMIRRALLSRTITLRNARTS